MGSQDSFTPLNVTNKASLYGNEEVCEALNLDLKCQILWDDNNKVTSIGRFARGTFEPRPDIAGPGVCFL